MKNMLEKTATEATNWFYNLPYPCDKCQNKRHRCKKWKCKAYCEYEECKGFFTGVIHLAHHLGMWDFW